jgi:hypothetical protein
MFASRLMKLAVLAGLLALAAVEQASAADQIAPRVSRAPSRIPLALRTLSHHSAAVLASDPCWRGCTAHCGGHFQACVRIGPLDACLAHNNACELACLRQCRLAGGPFINAPGW